LLNKTTEFKRTPSSPPTLKQSHATDNTNLSDTVQSKLSNLSYNLIWFYN